MKRYGIYTPIVVFVMLAAFTLSSCNDWLTVDPENSLIKEKFWKRTEDVEGALAASYNAFRDAAEASLIWGELRADMYTFGTNTYSDYTNIAESNISPSNGKISWTNYYKAINLANTLMYYDDEVFAIDRTFTQELKDAIEAEALFIRSISYFYLVRLWKDVPLYLEPTISDQSDLFLPKSSENVVIAQIIQDLLRAKDLAYTDEYKNDAANPTYFNGRANKYSIMALLADVYLWNQQYEKCIEYCDLVAASGLYGLEETPEAWYSLYNPGNSPVESIFEIQFDDGLESQENPIYNNLLGDTRATPNVRDLFDNSADIRFLFGGVFKYRGVQYGSTETRSDTDRDANIIYYRYADILLMKAEAYCELERFTEANEAVREIAGRAGTGHVNVDNKKDLRTAILNERAREFAFEGKRWFDLLRAAKRNNFENKQIIINMILAGADIKQQAVLRTKVFDTLSYFLPIPEHEIRYNQNLIQNPYYDR